MNKIIITSISIILYILFIFLFKWSYFITNLLNFNINNILFIYYLISIVIIILNHYNNIIISRKSEFIVLLFFFLFSLFIILYNKHFFTIFLTLESYSLSTYLLILSKINPSLKSFNISYFLVGTLSSTLFLLAIAIIYYQNGTLDINELYYILPYNDNNLNNIASILIFISILFKLGLFPFQNWVLRIYPYIQRTILSIIIIIPKIVFILLLFNLLYLFKYTHWNYNLTTLIAFGSILISLYLGYNILNNQIRYLITISSILNIGQILLFISIFQIILLEININNLYLYYDVFFSFLFFIILYSLNTLLIFLIYHNLLIFYADYKNYIVINLLNNKSLIFYNILFFLSILSLIGIPPLAGFYTKYFLIRSLLLSNNTLLIFSSLLIIFATFASSIFYLYFLLSPISSFNSNLPLISNLFPKGPGASNKNLNISIYYIIFLFLFILFFPLFFPTLSSLLLYFLS